MIIPSYWAEARKQHIKAGKQITVRRFGWSDTSQSEAEKMAESRVHDALQQILAGKNLEKREPKVAYNGAKGVPIREQILARYGDAVITRNSYGAKCLNTPDVLFADIDFNYDSPIKFKFIIFFLVAILIIGWGMSLPGGCQSNKSSVIGLLLLAMIFTSPLIDLINKFRIKLLGGIEKLSQKRIIRFLAKHPDWNLRLYRTPAGIRLIATHQLFRPNDPEVSLFFEVIKADSLYTRMCINQQCFRARLTAKPWRIGISGHMKPRPGTWPVRPERLQERNEWLTSYDKQAENFAACKYIGSLGSGKSNHPKIAEVIALHDEESKANITDIKIA